MLNNFVIEKCNPLLKIILYFYLVKFFHVNKNISFIILSIHENDQYYTITKILLILFLLYVLLQFKLTKSRAKTLVFI